MRSHLAVLTLCPAHQLLPRILADDWNLTDVGIKSLLMAGASAASALPIRPSDLRLQMTLNPGEQRIVSIAVCAHTHTHTQTERERDRERERERERDLFHAATVGSTKLLYICCLWLHCGHAPYMRAMSPGFCVLIVDNAETQG
jgi:hypothetical protein